MGEEHSCVGVSKMACTPILLTPILHDPLLCLSSGSSLRSLAKHLRQIPAAASERSAIFGLDPTHLANLVRQQRQMP